MPVTLPPAESPEPRPSPPRTVIWLCILTVVMAVGVVITLITWPKGAPTGTENFWLRLVVYPLTACVVAFGVRLVYYWQVNVRIDADNRRARQDWEKVLRFASEPLAVSGYAYLTAAGRCDVASTLSQVVTPAGTQTSPDGSNAPRQSTLTLDSEDEDTGRHRACFRELIDSVAGAVRAIPLDVPFGVRLQLPDDVDHEALLNTWQACWADAGLRTANAVLVKTETGVMMLDEWLDNRGGPVLEKFLLFVAVQLHLTLTENSTEAAVAIVLGWAPLARRRHIKPIALLHRPVVAKSDTSDVPISTALQWGRTTGEKIKDLWQTGLTGADKAAATKSMSTLSIGVSQTSNLTGIHDICTALGHPGNAAGWLTVVLGIEHAIQKNNPQLLAWREGTLRFAVVRPVA